MSRQKLTTIGTIIVGISLLGWLAYSWYQSVTANYAQEAAKPIEEALVRAGARKMCSTGDDGRGADNQTPWYESYFELQKQRNEAISIINNIATDNGYKLSHASPTNRGFLGFVSDDYINDWLFDGVSKKAPYSNVQPGSINIGFGVSNDGKHELSDFSCGKPVTINSGPTSSMITLSIRIPNIKR